MREYGAVHTRFWQSDDVRRMSEDARHLAIYLLTCPHSNSIGCFRLPDGYVSADVGWQASRIGPAMAALAEIGFANRFEKSQWVLIHRYLRWNPVVGPKSVAGAAKLLKTVPDDAELRHAVQVAISRFSSELATHVTSWSEASSMDLRHPFNGPSKGYRYGFHNRVADQDQDQDHKNPSQESVEHKEVGAAAAEAEPSADIIPMKPGRVTR